MRHNLLSVANGLHTPPCGTSRCKSSNFILTSLLVFLMTFMGSGNAWADTYFKPGETVYVRVSGDCKNWYNFGGWAVLFYYTGSDNIAYGQDSYNAGLWGGTGDLSSYVIRQDTYSPSVSSGKSIYKITNVGDESNNERILSFTIPTDGTSCIDRFRICRLEQDVNNNYINGAQNIVSASGAGTGKNRVYYSAWQSGDGTWETGTGQTITTTTCGGGEEPAERAISTDYRLRGDLWVYDNSGNWAGKDHNPEITPKPYKETDGTYTFSYVAPVANKNRFTVMVGGGSDISASKADGSSSDVTEDGAKYKFNVSSSPKQVDVTYYPSTTKAKVLISDYTPVNTGWYFKCESAIGGVAANTNTAMGSDGTLTLVNVAEGTYNFYIHDNASELYWGFNKFGGCYVDQTNSTASLISSLTTDAKFDSKQWPIKSVSDRKVKMVVGAGDAGKNIRVSFDGGKIVLTAITPPAPAVTYTVTIHPNGGTAVSPLSVGKGNTISSISSTYGQGTAKWYIDNDPDQEFVLGTSTVEGDMDLYAKWGINKDIEDDYYIVGCLQTASDAGESGNWSNTLSRKITYDADSRTCSFTFVAPAGKYPFEIIKNQSWSNKINEGNYSSMYDNSKSNVTLSESNGHLLFELSEPKQVTVSYDGKVWVNVTDYSFDNSKIWRIKTSWDTGEGEWHYNTVMTNNGTTNATAILRNVSGTRSFIISTKTNDDDAQAVIGNETFNALYVDMSSPSSGLTWNTTSAKRDGSNNFNSTTPQADGNYWRNCKFTLAEQSDIRITFDGAKIRCDILPKYTVTFNSKGGSAVAAQTLFEGLTVSEPGAPTKDGYTFVKWQKEGADYNFSSAVNGNIQLDAVWAYKAISGVSLNESEHTTWVGNSDFTLTPTLDPTDGIAKSVTWSSNKESVATVSNGTVHAVAAGEVRITVTVTDQFDNVRTAYCDVTVAACQMTTDNLYSMTVTGYNSSTGGSATLNGLWNQAADNTEPASMTITRLAFQKKDVGSVLYAYDDNGIVKVKEDASGNDVQWILIPVGTSTVTPSWNGGNACQLYYIKSMATGKYMYRGSTGVSTGNEDWYYSVTNTNTTIDTENLDAYQWFFINENDNQRCIFVKSGIGSTKAHSYKLHTSNQYNDCTDTYAAKPYLPVGCTGDINAYARSYKNTNDFSYDTYNNPNYVLSQVNSDYYRMNTDATVQANLAAALVKGAIITVRLYADAATSVKLEKTDGTEVATIDLSADATREYTYTVNTASALLGESAFVIKAADNHAAISSITVSRLHAVSPSTPDFTWDDDLSAGITQSTLAGNIVHTASSTESLGAIFYTSSNPSVASVAADGTVTPIMAGTTTITALIEEAECYAERAITYDITLTEPTLSELIDADNGTGITLTHNYAEDVVINKAVTINGGGYSIGNLTVENAGDLTLGSALTVNDFTLCAKAGNTSTPAESGQVRNANNLTATGNAYFLYTVDPSGQVHYGWYDFTVPFPVNVMTGIKGIQSGVMKDNFQNEVDYAIMEFLGDKQAEGQYPYKKFRSVMQPNKLYSITLDDDYNYNTIRFQKTNDGALVANNSVTLNAYAGIGTYDNWNGVGNGTLHHADAGISAAVIQVYQSGDKSFLPVETANYSLITGSAFLVQETGTMTLNQADGSHPLLAPSRETPVQPAIIQIAPEGKPFSDQLFISADEMAGSVYTQGVDLAKAGEFGKATVPQIGTNAYNTLLCVHEAQLINGKAQYDLSLYAPANGTYTLTANRISEDKTLYLTFNGRVIWNLSVAETYELDLNKGITTEYGLLLVENYNAPTDMEIVNSEELTVKSQKVLRNGILYILRNGEVFDAQGARVK